MLKPIEGIYNAVFTRQPPSGGCVLKLDKLKQSGYSQGPAAFGRLCVETAYLPRETVIGAPAAFGRLCVETYHITAVLFHFLPAAFGRLCVETSLEMVKMNH